MKISINSTFSYIKFNLNYGSTLQCYALQQYLKKRGHEPEHLRDYRANPVYILKRLKNIRYFRPFCKKLVASVKMQKFINTELGLSSRGYLSERGLKKHPPKVDCHIVGSDQVWRNTNRSRYLTYASDDTLKLSYAASFGRDSLPVEMEQTIAPWLSRFDGISVREKSGVDIVEQATGKTAEHVLDPTLLLNWEEYPYKDNGKCNYCFGYFLNLNDKNDVAYDRIKETVQQKGKEFIATVPLNYPMLRNENLVFPSVEDWLGFYKNADFVFTNTYHGLLFCIIFKKQFLFFKQRGSGERENERFYSLVNLLNLQSRMITTDNADQISALMEEKIDYESVYRCIEKERTKTDEFFQKYGL